MNSISYRVTEIVNNDLIYAYSDSNIGGFYGGCVVDTVVRHGGHGTEGFPGVYDPGFMLGLHPGINARFLYFLQKLLVG